MDDTTSQDAEFSAEDEASDETQATLPEQNIINDNDNGEDSNAGQDESPADAALKALHDYIPETYKDNSAEADDDDDRIGDEQFTTAYDIIEHMEQLIEEAKTGVFNADVAKINKSEFLDLLHDLKKDLPVQLERASALMREAERRLENAQTQSSSIVSDAHSQAAGIIREANEQAQFLAGQENVVSIATQKARGILDNAQDKANQLTAGANRYAQKSMHDLDEQITEIHNSIQSGLEVLHERQKQAEQEIPRLSADDYPDRQ
ncbi:hypothetical protein [Scardovia wiggsiae]